MDQQALRQFFEEQIPFNRWLGMTVVRLEAGFAHLRVPFRPELVGDPLRPALHGGVISTIADACGGLAIFGSLDDLGQRVATIDLRVDYLRPGLLSDIDCEARILRIGNRVGVTSMVVRQGQDYVTAEARGVYNILRISGEPSSQSRSGDSAEGARSDRNP